MQTKAGQCLELCASPFDAGGHEAFFFGEYRVGVFATANAPEQAVCFKARATAGAAWCVASVFGQEHANVHLVGFAFEVGKKTLNAKPLLVPFAVPVGRALQHPVLLLGREFEPGRVARNACGFGMAHQIILRFFPCRRLNGFDGAGAQCEFFVGNDRGHQYLHFHFHDDQMHPDCF